MTTILGRTLAENFTYSLGQLHAALTDCPDNLWEVDLWPDEAPTTRSDEGGLSGSAPWLVAHHALICLDYDLSGEFEPWKEPPPFDEAVWAVFPKRVFTRAEMLDYVDYCRGRVQRVTDSLTDELADRPLPETHRYGGKPYGHLISGAALHTVEHAAQICQFIRLTALHGQPAAAS